MGTKDVGTSTPREDEDNDGKAEAEAETEAKDDEDQPEKKPEQQPDDKKPGKKKEQVTLSPCDVSHSKFVLPANSISRGKSQEENSTSGQCCKLFWRYFRQSEFRKI